MNKPVPTPPPANAHMVVYSAQYVDARYEALEQIIKSMQLDILILKAALPDWIMLEEAIKLTGRSQNWFRMHRLMGDLPIAFLPRTEGSSRYMYSRKDCVAYGRKRAILPPVHIAPII